MQRPTVVVVIAGRTRLLTELSGLIFKQMWISARNQAISLTRTKNTPLTIYSKFGLLSKAVRKCFITVLKY